MQNLVLDPYRGTSVGDPCEIRPSELLAERVTRRAALGLEQPPALFGECLVHRCLEGAWAKIWFTTKLKGRPLELAEVEDELQDILIEESKQALTAETIQKRVATHYDIRLADMTSKRRTANIAFPRQVAMYLCRSMTRASLQEIGEAFGGRDHGTVIHACRLVDERLKEDTGLKQAINQLTKQLSH